MRTRTWISGLGLLLIAVGGFALANRDDSVPPVTTPISGEAAAPSDPAEPRPVSTAPLPVGGIQLTPEPFVLVVRATGRAETLRRAALSSPLSERVTEVRVREGATVRRGDVLVRLDPRPSRIARNEARARVANAEADYRLRIHDDPSVSEETRELVAHRVGLTEAKEALARAELDIEGTRIVAPFDAAVAAVPARAGERIRAGDPLVELVGLDSVRVSAEVLETDFGNLAVGAGASLRFAAWPDEVFRGEVAALSPEIDAERGAGTAWIVLANSDGRIRPGMWADVEIDGTIHADRLAVPRDAVLERDRRLLVFRARGGRAEWSYVETGLETADRIEIVDGVAASDTVLVDGHWTLAHGAPVSVSLRR